MPTLGLGLKIFSCGGRYGFGQQSHRTYPQRTKRWGANRRQTEGSPSAPERVSNLEGRHRKRTPAIWRNPCGWRTRPARERNSLHEQTMPNKSRQTRDSAQSIPAALAEVALIDARTCAATGGMGISWWHARVAAGEAPQPVIQQPRMTRWRLADVRSFWATRAAAANKSAPANNPPKATRNASQG